MLDDARLRWRALAGRRPGPGQVRRAHDVLAPLVGLYAGQYLMAAIPGERRWGLLVAAVSLVLWAVRLRRPDERGRADLIQIGLGLLVGLPLALNATGWLNTTPSWQLIAVWLLGAGLVAAPLLRRPTSPIDVGLEFHGFDRRDALLALALVAGALLLRVPWIETLPAGVDTDEGSLAHTALNFATGLSNDPFGTGWVTHPNLGGYLHGFFIRWLGPTFLAMRLPSAIVGALAVGATYLLARVGLGRRVALMAGVLMLTANVAVHFSRLGLNNIVDSLLATSVLAALWAAGATGRPAAYALAGLGLGLTPYFYFGGRAVPFVAAAQLTVWWLADRQGVRRAGLQLLGMLAVAVAVAQPLLGHLVRSPSGLTDHLFVTIPFSSHMADFVARTGVSQAAVWRQHVVDSLLVFTTLPDPATFYNSGLPMLHPLQAPLFLIGLVAVLTRWRRPFFRGLVAWILVTLILGSVLMTDAAAFHRLLGVLPAAVLVTAIGIEAGARALTRSLRWSPAAGVRLAVAAVVLLAVVDAHFYFREYGPRHAYETPPQEAVSTAALEYTRLGGDGTFVLVTGFGVNDEGTIGHSILSYVAGDAFLGGVPAVLDEIEPSGPLTFYVLPDRAEALADLETRFPGGERREYRRPVDDELLMTRYRVEP